MPGERSLQVSVILPLFGNGMTWMVSELCNKPDQVDCDVFGCLEGDSISFFEDGELELSA